MHPDLEAIVSADEEARSRVTLAERRHERELSAAREERDRASAAARKEAADALEVHPDSSPRKRAEEVVMDRRLSSAKADSNLVRHAVTPG